MKPSTLCLIIMVLLFGSLLQAAPHQYLPVQAVQPDGATINIFASGDEFHNWFHDENNYTIVRAEDGSYVYAEASGRSLVAGSLLVGRDNPASRSLPMGLNLSQEEIRTKYARNSSIRDYSNGRSPHTGQFNNLVVFIKFADSPDFTQPITTYQTMFNDATPGANSMKNYFAAASYQQLSVDSFFYPEPNGTAIVSYTDVHPRAYFSPYSASNPKGYNPDNDDRTIREHTLLANAIAAIAPSIPASLDLDGDDDGYIDNVCFIIQGSTDGWAELLWPHRWTLYAVDAYLQGALVWDFNFQLENSLSSSGASVLSHEMFHSLGAPDLYRYEDNTITPIGGWDLMASNSNPPQHMSVWMKYRYGQWVPAPPMITESGEYTLSPVATSSTNNIYRIPSWRSNESYIVEYRKADTMYDTTLPGYGLLVYRLDTRENGNAGGPPDELYIYRPDGSNTTTNGILSQAAFSANSGRTMINETTSPNGFLGNNASGGLNLFEVSQMGETISFRVKISDVQVTQPKGGETWFYGTNKTITWKAKNGLGSVKIEFSSDGGENWSVVTASTLNNGTYNWQGLPLVDSAECHIRITHLTTGQMDSNYYPFEIISQVAIPTPVFPVNGQLDAPTNPLLSWDLVSGATGYHLQVSTDPGFSSYLVNLIGTPSNSYRMSGLQPFSTYYWRVATQSDMGDGPFCDDHSFTTGQITELPAVPQLVSPANYATSLPMNPSFSWTSSYLAESYRIQISTSPYYSTIAQEAENLPEPSYQAAALAPNTTYFWRVSSHNPAGYSNFTTSRRFTTGNTVADEDDQAPPAIDRLAQNYPNPFNPSTTISLQVKAIGQPLRLKIYNTRGQLVRTLFDGSAPSLELNLVWDGRDQLGNVVGSGMYLYRMESGSFVETRRMVLIK